MLTNNLANHVFILSKTSQTFLQRIEEHYPALSSNARTIADRLLHNPMDVVNYSVADLAQLTQTSKATVSRFFRQIGYDSHQLAKQELIDLRVKGYPLGADFSHNSDFEDELTRVKQTLNNIEATHLEQFTQAICSASRVTLIGFRNSYPLALHFRQQLLQLRSKVRLLPQPGQTLSEELQDISQDELFIVMGFRRRPKLLSSLIASIPKQQIVLLADPSGHSYKEQVKLLIVCQLGQSMALDSYAAPMSVISIVCNKVLTNLGSSARKRIEDISKDFERLSEIE